MANQFFSKEAIKGFLLDSFHNDPRITDELLFNGKQMTLQCYMLLKAALGAEDRWRNSFLDDIGYHCYITFEYKCEDNALDYTKELLAASDGIKRIKERLNTMLADNECYFISDAVSGAREHGDEYGNRNRRWGTGLASVTIDIWVFGRSGDVMEFGENNSTKAKLLLNTEL